MLLTNYNVPNDPTRRRLFRRDTDGHETIVEFNVMEMYNQIQRENDKQKEYYRTVIADMLDETHAKTAESLPEAKSPAAAEKLEFHQEMPEFDEEILEEGTIVENSLSRKNDIFRIDGQNLTSYFCLKYQLGFLFLRCSLGY